MNKGRETLFKIFRCLLIVLAAVACVFFDSKLKDFKNKVEIYNNTNEELNNKIDFLSSACDDLEKQVTSINETENLSSDIESTLKTLNNNISTIESNYVTKNEFDEFSTKVDNILSKDYSAYAKNVKEEEVKELSNMANKQTENLQVLSQTKIDVANKVNEYTEGVTTEDKYLDMEYVNELLDGKFASDFDKIFPVGSIYISLNGVCPSYGTWEKLEAGRTLWNTDDGGLTYLEPTLPNVKGNAGSTMRTTDVASFMTYTYTGGLKSHSTYNWYVITMDLSRQNSIYKDGATVRPQSISVTVFKRVA